MGGFLTLDEVLLPPAVASGITVLLAAGFVRLGRRLAQRAGIPPADALGECAGFVAVVAGVAAVIHTAALAGAVRLWWLRAMGALLATCGALEVVHVSRRALRRSH